MELSFSKYQGTGNDFIMFDDRDHLFPANEEIIQKLCHRKFGIGADGLILIQPHTMHDYKMVYFNADGTQSLCGNGSRCGFSFARTLNMVKDEAVFETTDGIHKIKEIEGLIYLQLFDTPFPEIKTNSDWYLNTGSPHHIVIVDDVEGIDVVNEGKRIRYSRNYSSQNGTNVNFAQLLPNKIRLRTYERGVEGETMSCGTGATAVGIVAGSLGMKSPVTMETRGGELIVSFTKEDKKYTDIWLAGPASKVFEGTVTI